MVFESCESVDDLAGNIGVSSKQIKFLVYCRKEEESYKSFCIPKKRGGQRVIEAPKEDLKNVQLAIKNRLSEFYSPPSGCYGFVGGGGVVKNAECHIQKRYVVKADIKDFFGSVNAKRVNGIFKHLGASRKISYILTQVCTKEGRLPQGAPSSPILSNMVAYRMDRQLIKLANKNNIVYTRYADDITFSLKSGYPPDGIVFVADDGWAWPGKELNNIVEANGFSINIDKFYLHRNDHRQIVTGVKVNKKTNVSRGYIRQTRAMINSIQKDGRETAREKHFNHYPRKGKRTIPPIEKIVWGRLEHIKNVRGPGDRVLKKLQGRFFRVVPEYKKVINKDNKVLSEVDVFICHKKEDKNRWATPLAEELKARGWTVWYDEYEMIPGDSLSRKITQGLEQARYGFVLLSRSFLEGESVWLRRELGGLRAKEKNPDDVRVVPIWCDVDIEDVRGFDTVLADQFAANFRDNDVSSVVDLLETRLMR